MIYEIQFDANGTEYDYEIAAEDGTILTADTESVASNTAAQNGQQNNTQNNQSQSAGANVAVSQEQAMQTALERVPGRQSLISGWNLTTMMDSINTKGISSTIRENTNLRLTRTQELY